MSPLNLKKYLWNRLVNQSSDSHKLLDNLSILDLVTSISLGKGTPIVFDNDSDHPFPEALLSSLVGEAYSLSPGCLDFYRVLWSISHFILAEYGKLAEDYKLLKESVATPGLNSGNSGISPSSFLNILNPPTNHQEIVESPPPLWPGLIDLTETRYQGAQEGHEPHFRKPLTEEEATKTIYYGQEFIDSACPVCGSTMVRDPDNDKKFERNRLPKLVIEKELHIGMAYLCPDCGKIHRVEPPKAVQNDILDESLLSLMGIMKGGYKISLRNIQDFFSQFLGLDLSLGKVNDSLKAVSMALRPIYLEVKDKIKFERVLNIDETSFKIKKKRIYTWAFLSKNMVLFKNGTRSVFNLEDVLGKYFNGTIICDCYAAYFAFIKNLTNAMLSLCWAHLLREYIFCYDCLSAEVHRYGEKCILILKELFVEYRAYMEILDKTSPKAEEIFARLLELKKKITEATLDAPPDSKKPNLLAKRFQEHGEYYFTFLFNLDVTPTNNAAERLIRSIVIDRKISYGVQSNLGSYFCETIWTVIENLDLKGISPREFLTDALKRYKSGEPLPSIINIGETVPQKYIDEAKEERERILIDRKIETTKQKAARKAAPKTVAKATETDDMASKSDSGNQNNVEKKAMDENPAASDIVTNSPEIATKTPLKADQKPMDESPSASDLNTANGMKYPKAIPKKPPGTDHKAMDENPLFVPTREKPLVASPMVANDPGNEKPLETKSTGYARNTPNPRPETVGANPKRPDPTPGQTNPQPSSNGVEPREPQQEWRGPKLSKAIRQKLLELTYCHRPSKAPEQTESSGACPPGPHRRKVASEVSPV